MEKFKFISGCKKSPYDHRDLLVRQFLGEIVALPENIDYTDKMTPIKNQGKEGSCTGFSAAYLKEYQEKIDYELKGDKYIQLSPRFAYETAKEISHSTEGSTMKAVSEGLIKKGICEEKLWPYIAGNPGKPQNGAYDNAIKYRESPIYARVTNEKELKASLVKFGPIIIGVLVYKNWYRQQWGHIPNPSWLELMRGPLGGHAICLCAYNDKTQEYKFINSWGEKWGERGFGYLTYKHMKMILQDAFCLIDVDDPKSYNDTVGKLSWKEKKSRWV